MERGRTREIGKQKKEMNEEISWKKRTLRKEIIKSEFEQAVVLRTAEAVVSVRTHSASSI